MMNKQSHIPAIETSLSGRLFRRILPVVLGVSAVIGGLLIIYQAVQEKNTIDAESQKLLMLFAEPARQALQQQDPVGARQVAQGLLAHSAVSRVVLERYGNAPLLEQVRPLQSSVWRHLADWLPTPERQLVLELETGDQHLLPARLKISLDTAGYVGSFMRQSGIILLLILSGIVMLAAGLSHVLRQQLARPLSSILRQMQHIDPEHAGAQQLSILPGHQHDELGQWVGHVNHLLLTIDRANQQRAEAKDNLLHMSHVDFLTGLPNRLGLQGKLDEILGQARRSGQAIAVMCIGLDGFKAINERHSFQSGDLILRSFAQRVGSQLSAEQDSFARLGGDQFVLIHAGLDNSYQAAVLAQKVLFLLQQPFRVQQPGQSEIAVRLSATIGITLFPGDAQTSELLLQKAEQTMRLSKMSGRNRYQFYSASIDQQLRERRQLEGELERAIVNQELHLLYQIQFKLGGDKRAVGAEALLRWRRSNGELVSPDIFIPLAEQTGAIVKIGEWVLEKACEQLRDWLDIGWQDFRIAVNLSAVQLLHQGLVPTVERIMAAYRIPPDCLELEVTETSLMQDVKTASRQLVALRRLGVAIAIDDFGTGHSSLAYLKRLPLDKIKIDRSFVQDMQSSGDDATIVSTIIQLSHGLQLKVLAEGVETRETERLLEQLGCDEGQGYLYGKPVTADALFDAREGFDD